MKHYNEEWIESNSQKYFKKWFNIFIIYKVEMSSCILLFILMVYQNLEFFLTLPFENYFLWEGLGDQDSWWFKEERLAS